MLRVLVCGDRNWTDYELIAKVLDGLMNERPDSDAPYLTVIHGCARGADSLACQWVDRNYVYYDGYVAQEKFIADWDQFGRAAGPIRNRRMLKEGKPDRVIAFHDDIEHSKGTKNMVTIAREEGIPVEIITHDLHNHD